MKKIYLLILVGIMLLNFTGCAKADDPIVENKLTVYSPNSEGIMNAVIPLFEQETGIKVEVISAGTGELMARIDSEKNAPIADIMFGGTNSLYQANNDLFMDYVSPENDNLYEDFKSQDAFVTNYVLDGRVLIVNKDLAGGIKIEGYSDLLNPALKGKIASADPTSSSSAFSQLVNMLLANGGFESPEAWVYVEELIQQLDGKINPSSSGVYKSVLEGEMVVGLTYEDPILKLIMDGADNIEIVYPVEGAHFTPSSMGIIKGASNVEAAQKFIDFVLGEEIQTIFGTELTNRPIREGVTTGAHLVPLESINTVQGDMSYVDENKEKLIEEWTTLFAKYN
ncbi:MAG: extracellular solute-binding protein [Erysipelotrichales bacterium]|nr:extracellular solute-binding protein [Erysipelotrichales bacterium]